MLLSIRNGISRFDYMFFLYPLFPDSSCTMINEMEHEAYIIFVEIKQKHAMFLLLYIYLELGQEKYIYKGMEVY